MATSIARAELPVIKAAGGLLVRNTPRGEEVMIVYRKRHQDWTLPKGKLKDGESFQEAALREVEEETGCNCRLGSYLGVISYAYGSLPKVVMFWKMSVVREQRITDIEEIGEALWLPVAAAIQRLTHAQEKSLLARVAGAPKPAAPPPEPIPAPEPLPIHTQPRPIHAEPAPRQAEPVPFHSAAELESLAPVVPEARAERGWPRRSFSFEDRRNHARLARDLEAFKVELAFLERRSQQPGASWMAAANEHITQVERCLDTCDVEGALQGLRSARRYAVLGMNPAELAARAQVLREEARKLSSWRAVAIQRLLTVAEDNLTAARVADAMGLRDEAATDQTLRARIVGDRLRVLLLACAMGGMALLLSLPVTGPVHDFAPVFFLGLLGSSLAAAQALILGRSEGKLPNRVVLLALVLPGAGAALPANFIYGFTLEYFKLEQQYTVATFALALLLGYAGERVLAHFAGYSRERTSAGPY